MSQPYVWVIVALGGGWFLQLLLTYRQLRLFYKRYRDLRQEGPAAIATHGSIYSGRVYVLLVTDRDMVKVLHAERLSGWTVFAQLRPVEPVVGLDLDAVAGDQPIPGVSRKVRKAFGKAAAEIAQARDRREEGDTEVSV